MGDPLNPLVLVVEDYQDAREMYAAYLQFSGFRVAEAVNARVNRTMPLVKTDRQKVKQIVLNLLSNALKFTPTGSVTIAVGFDGRSRTMTIAVRDTGVGIPDEARGRIFEDFRQLDDSPTRGYGGTGLGLSICRRLAQMLDGSIDLESEVGQGSTFTLRLPVRARRR